MSKSKIQDRMQDGVDELVIEAPDGVVQDYPKKSLKQSGLTQSERKQLEMLDRLRNRKS